MADINYAKNYAPAGEISFAKSFSGSITKTPIHHYLGGYTENYVAQYTKAYEGEFVGSYGCLLYTSPSPRD